MTCNHDYRYNAAVYRMVCKHCGRFALPRSAFRGWTWKLGEWELEFVTVQHVLRVVALSRNFGRKLVKRWEW